MRLLKKLKKIMRIGNKNLEDSVHDILDSNDDSAGAMEEKEIIENLIEFKDLKAYELMVPRTEIISASKDLDIREMAKIFIESGHTRIPIHGRDLDDVIGFMHVKDLLKYLVDSKKKFEVDNEVREILYVPRAMKVTELLKRMKDSIIHIAVVLDEYGGADGIITIGDLIAEIVGDIKDEHGESNDCVQIIQDDDGFTIDARAEIELVEETLNMVLNSDEGEFETIGGFILAYLGRIPLKGEKFTHPSGVEIEILEAEAKKIKKIHLRKIEEASI